MLCTSPPVMVRPPGASVWLGSVKVNVTWAVSPFLMICLSKVMVWPWGFSPNWGVQGLCRVSFSRAGQGHGGRGCQRCPPDVAQRLTYNDMLKQIILRHYIV